MAKNKKEFILTLHKYKRMKNVLMISCILLFSCHASKKNSTTSESSITQATSTNNKASIIKPIADVVLPDTINLPICIQKKIDSFKLIEKALRPERITAYQYKGATVYLVTNTCCDNFADLYDSNCKLLGHPTGGFTGKGDRNFPNFNDEVSKEKLIWDGTGK